MLASEVAATFPEMTAVTLSPPLLYGTMLRFVTPDSLSISATKCGVLAVPAVDQLTPLSPCFFAHSTNSFAFDAGTDGCTTMTEGATAIMPTGTRSLSAYGMSLRIMLLVMTPAAPISHV